MTTQQKDWVVMIYMAADNDLGDESVWALTEIASVDLNEKIGVAVLFDSGVREVPTRVFKFGLGAPKPNFLSALNPALGKTFNTKAEEKKATVPGQLKKFLKQTMKEHPAEHYMLILSGHGSGAVGDFLKGGPDSTGMSIAALSKAIQQATSDSAKQIDVLGMDSCLMSMVEVCYQLPQNVKFLVGSEGYDPTTGWPYKPILRRLSKFSPPTPLEAAQAVVDEYVSYYTDYIIAGTSVDIALCELSESNKNKLASAIKELVADLKKSRKNRAVLDAIILAHWEAQAYKRETYTDLWDFCDLLQERFQEDDPIAVHCNAVKEAIQEMTHSYSRYYGPEFQHSHGLSIYFPWREFEGELKEYVTLDFAKKKKTDWGDFLENYLEVTRREKRGEKRIEKGEKTGIAADGIEEILFTPPLGAGGIFFQVHKAGNPPDKAGNPPDRAGNPPDKMGVFTRSASMKNPPNGFLVKKSNRRKAIFS